MVDEGVSSSPLHFAMTASHFGMHRPKCKRGQSYQTFKCKFYSIRCLHVDLGEFLSIVQLWLNYLFYNRSEVIYMYEKESVSKESKIAQKKSTLDRIKKEKRRRMFI